MVAATRATVSAPPEPAPPAATRRWCRGTWLVMSAAVGWLVFVALHLLLSGRAWWWSLPELLPPLAFVVTPVALAAVAPLARPARGRIAAVLLAAVVIGWDVNGINLAGLGHRPAPPPPDAVTFFAWNTWYWDQLAEVARQPPPGGTPPGQVADFYRYLREQEADVYLLQEYLYYSDGGQPIRVDDTDRLRRELPGYQVAAMGELVTISRYPIVASRGLDLRRWLPGRGGDLVPAGSGFPDYFRAKTLRTDLRIGDRIVSFYNSHFHVPAAGWSLHREQTRADSRTQHALRRANVRALAADLADNPHPAVLAGDLNTSPAMGLRHTLPDQLVDATPALGSLYPASWHDQGFRLWRVDWVLTTPDITVHRYRFVPSGALSDHSGQNLVLSVRS